MCIAQSCPTLIYRFPSGSDSKESAFSVGDLGLIPGSGRSPGEKMATHSSILAWEITWTEEPGGLRSMGLQRVGQDLATKQQQSLFTADFLGRTQNIENFDAHLSLCIFLTKALFLFFFFFPVLVHCCISPWLFRWRTEGGGMGFLEKPL